MVDQVLQLSSGIFLHLDLCFSVDFAVYSTLEGSGYTHDEMVAKREWIANARACDLGIFQRGFRKLFPTAELMASPLAQAHLKLSRDMKTLHTHRSERGHARERKDLNAAAAPGIMPAMYP